ncbi:unnamed protein product [Caenorhabditis auriculariae]|uniref:Major sperm protein n=1 Tax=Caenorhabditis auriculariae TaxID=2777116 RepID=A0A8S1GM62_9PELO|nr:unnamed protein product [Caenorhabditis auriculariae]
MTEGKVPQVLQIVPPRELVFQGPFTDVVTSFMTLRNPTSKSVCFKVKTTAPKQYCVRPNSGVIAPGESKVVTVMLQPIDSIPVDANKHKFMVQSCAAPSDEVDNLDVFWKSINPADLMYSKLMVVFADKRNSGDAETHENHSVKEESAASVTYVGESASSPSTVTGDSSAALRKSLSAALEDKDRALRKLETLQKELEELFKQNRKLQQKSEGVAEIGIPTLQVVLMAVAALLIGLIFGRMF